MKQKILKKGLWVFIVLSFFHVNDACAWWNEDWQYRKKISINTTENGANLKENIMDVPILFRLHSGNFEFNSALPTGDDIRFVSSDDTQLLKHHIEQYDTIDEMALVWVKLPRLSGNTDQEFIWLYYGNKNAMGGQDHKGTYDTHQAAVFHLSEVEKQPMDVSSNGQTVSAFSAGLGLPAVIGRGAVFNGAGDMLQIAHSPTLKIHQGFTFSAWLRINQPQADAYLLHTIDDSGELILGIDGTKLYARLGTSLANIYETEKSVDLPLGHWSHITVTGAPNQRLTIYIDGIEMTFVNIREGFPNIIGDFTIGAAQDDSHGYAGDVDEVQFSTVSRSAAWAHLAYASQGPDGMLYNLGIAEMSGTDGQFNAFLMTTAQVMRNITMDGWVIISVLIGMGATCCVIFILKAFGLRQTDMENKSFSASFIGLTDPVENDLREEDLPNSNLSRVFHNGRRVYKDQLMDNPSGIDMALKTLKAALDQLFLEESRRLNAGLLMLTMTITGGPFLGLLGTVWGVMSTFAAMAEAGEANIAAIAPGVASALATTVAGLLVAIPALFGYNYLLSRVKAVTADLLVFIDQFCLKVERIQTKESDA